MNAKSVVSFSSVGIVFNFLLMVMTFIFIRKTSSHETGLYFYYVSIGGLFSNVLLFGNATLLNKEFVGSQQPLNLFPRIRFYLFLTFLAILIYVFLFEEYKEYAFLLILETSLFKVYRERLYASYIRSFGGVFDYIKPLFINFLLRFFGVFLYFFGFLNVFYLVLFFILASMFSVFSISDFNKKVFFSGRIDDIYLCYFKDGWPYFLSAFFTLGYDYVPVLVLKFMHNDLHAIGVYSSNYKITSIFIIGLAIVTQSILPFFRNIYIQKGEKETLLNGIFVIVLFFVLYTPLYFIVLGCSEFVVSFFIGSEYIKYDDILSIQLAGVFGSIVNFIGFSVLQSINKQALVSFFVAPSAILNIFLCVFFSSDGAVGVSLSLTISLILSSFFLFVYLLVKYFRVARES